MKGDGRKENVVRERSYAFALSIIGLYRELTQQREYVLSKQMLRSGTSIGANVEEAQAAQSRADFTAKMSIASKEARECNDRLRLLHDSNIASESRASPLLEESDDLIRLLTSIVKSAQHSAHERQRQQARTQKP